LHDSTLLRTLSPYGVLTLTMNRPEVHNAFDDHQVLRLSAALEEAAANTHVRVIILASEGKSFSAGGDIEYMRRMGENAYEDNLRDGRQLARMLNTLDRLPKPTIARVQGAAIGGGVGLACCCDFAIGSPRTVFATSEAKLGMVAATISPYVVATVGQKAARRMFLSALPVSADQALGLGLLSSLVAHEELDAAVQALAKTLLKNGPQALRRSKELAFAVSDRPVTEALIATTVEVIAEVRESTEGREGLSAFLEKRSPNWIHEGE